MKHEPPKIEEYESETPNPAPAEKRKRGAKEKEQTQEQIPEIETQQPRNKAAKSSEVDGGYEEDESEEYVDGREGEDEEEYDEEYESEEGDERGEGEEEEQGEEEESTIDEPKAHKVIQEFGRIPLDRTPLSEKPLKPTPETILAMAMDTLVKSRPISHELTQKTVAKLIEVGYHDIRKLRKSSWEERTMVLKDGGYNRYREQGATNLGDLADFVEGKYDGDLNNLLKKAGHNRDKTRQLMKEIKGLGDLGVDLFLNNVQSVWPSMTPFVDGRSLQTAEEVGIGTDLETIYADLGRDPVEMSRFANGLSMVRLEKQQGRIEE